MTGISKPKYYMNISQKILHIRKQQGLTQEQLADRANVTVRTIQRIESGESVPRAYTIKTLAEALGTSYEALMDGTAEQPMSFDAAMEKHLLKTMCLSCFTYLVIPWFHFLIPAYLLRKSGISHPVHTRFARRVVMQQVNWVICLNVTMLLTLGYNLIVAHWFEKAFLLNYLWPFFILYAVNGVLILRNLRLVRAL